MQGIGKAITAVAALGAVGGISIGSYYALNNSQNIKGRLEEEKFTVLTSSSALIDWTAVLNKYKQEQTNTFTGKADAGNNVNEDYLQSKCSKILNNKSDDTNNYKLAKRWCVKEETINAILQKRGYTVLSTTEAKSEEVPAWEANLKELQKDTNKFKAIKDNINKIQKSENITALKEGCNLLQTGTIKTTDGKFEENIKLASQWCSSKKKDGK
ncbi:hypothetical protein A6V39_00850 [Candidatus Mycoplasma haematobovis]|uniref:Uncharacterized protein n=1 Tax=Candidatus Mycoplasma haematobovis TaxID=432608 RepID=A0A1A9QFX5_9MOLU|nr:hypothetical protein [Candidatus Mycoplasma haematobovis]OAL10600.1 hypothetical protein A6V39_00850 [Candidatus Mycoplasma haematobovis]